MFDAPCFYTEDRMEWFGSLHSLIDVPLMALRAVIGAIFLVHGWPKVTSAKEMATAWGKPNMAGFLRFLGTAETAGSLAVVAGFLTPLSAAGLSIIMLGAIWTKLTSMKTGFTAHDTTGWEFDLMILAGTVTLFFLGAGRFSIDRLLWGI
jgi:putative oxidoreductase